MTWLARLKNSALSPDSHPAKPTKPPFAGFAGTPAALSQNSGGDARAVNDPAQAQDFHREVLNEPSAVMHADGSASVAEVAMPQAKVSCDEPLDPDRHCWPQGMAMNTAEIDSFLRRQARFERQGLTAEVAEAIADSLMKRDRDGCQDMVLCLECVHLRRAGQWTCVNWQQAGWTASAMPRDLVQQLQRCPGFREGS